MSNITTSYLQFKILFIFILSFSLEVKSQEFYFVRGYVYSIDNQPIIQANIRIFNTETGTKTDNMGRFEVQVPQGLNRIGISHIGFKTQMVELVVEKDIVKNIFLDEEANQLEEVLIKVKRKDYSYEVIQNVIDNRKDFLNQYKNYSSEVYIKSTEKIERPALKQKNKPLENINASVLEKTEDAITKPKKDSIPNLNLFECKLTKHEEIPNKQKEERTAVKKLNDQSTLFYTTITDGDFNLYENLQYIPQISDNQFISPISNLAFASYKFKLLGSYFIENQKIYKIEVTPRKLGNALYEGEIEVYDNLWILKSINLDLNKRALRKYNDFNLKIEYEKIDTKWMPTLMAFEWKVKEGSTKKNGKCIVKQSNFEFDKVYPKKFFGAELGVTEAEAYKRDTTFWAKIRPEPLSKEEQKFILYKDSVSAVMNSKVFLDSVDAIYNKITFLKIAWKGVGHINRNLKREWYFNPVVTVLNPFAVGGSRVQYGGTHFKRFENRQYIRIEANAGYGFMNKDIRGNFSARYFYNPLRVSSISFYTSKNINFINGNATILDFIRRNNFYYSTKLGVFHITEIINGLYLDSRLEIEKREDLGDFKFRNNDPEFTGGFEPSIFPRSNLAQTIFSLAYTPKQLYLKEPNQKVILGSRFPTFQLRYTSTLGGKNTSFNKFSKINFSVRQTIQVGIFGTSEYRIETGRLLDTTRLAVMDYTYQRGGDPYFFSPSMNTFQLIRNTFPVFKWYLEGHYVHQFNGFLTSKVPLLNKTGIKTMAGGGFLIVPERSYQYSELFFGANRVFKFGRQLIRLGVYNVFSQNNQTGFRNMIKFSFEPFDNSKNSWSF